MVAVLVVALLAGAVALVARNPRLLAGTGLATAMAPGMSQSLIGVWQIRSGTGAGATIQINGDCGVTASGAQGACVWLDQSHIELDAGPFTGVYQVSVSSDQVTLVNQSGTTVLVLVQTVVTPVPATTGSQGIVGQWEITSRSATLLLGIGGDGYVIEFLGDGTYDMLGVAGTYSWPDSRHLRTNDGMLGSTVYLADVSPERLTLSNDADSLTLVPYRPGPPDEAKLAGVWYAAVPRVSSCFAGLSTDVDSNGTPTAGTPAELRFDPGGGLGASTKGALSVQTTWDLTGTFTIQGGSLHLSASGQTDYSVPIGGTVDCAAAMGVDRLVFTDNSGRDTVYIRAAAGGG